MPEQAPNRQATISRETGETTISLTLNLDGTGTVTADTGVLFFDHLLHAWAKHARVNLQVTARGDSEMDPHHTVEDTGIALGLAVREALGDRAGIERYGYAYAPLDESLARVVIDCSGRPYLDFHASMPEQMIGADFAASLIEEFWRAVAMNGALTMHVDLIRSRNAHHAAEAICKAAAVSSRMAFARTAPSTFMPSTKGILA